MVSKSLAVLQEGIEKQVSAENNNFRLRVIPHILDDRVDFVYLQTNLDLKKKEIGLYVCTYETIPK